MVSTLILLNILLMLIKLMHDVPMSIEYRKGDVSEIMGETLLLQNKIADGVAHKTRSSFFNKSSRLRFALRGALVSVFMAIPFNHNAEPNLDVSGSNTLENTHYVCGINVRVRSKPTINSSIITELNTGDLIVVERISDNWATITYDGERRFISETYIRPITDFSCERNRALKEEYRP